MNGERTLWRPEPKAKARTVAVALVGLALALSVATVVSAHSQDTKYPYFWFGPTQSEPFEKCAVGLARANHGNWNNGFSQAATYSVRIDFSGNPCTYPYDKPAGNMKVRWTWQIRSGGNWAYCRDGGIVRNTSTTWAIAEERHFQSRPCGGGTYRTVAFSGVVYNGNMHDDLLNSPAHDY